MIANTSKMICGKFEILFFLRMLIFLAKMPCKPLCPKFKNDIGPPHSLQVNVLFKNMKSLNLDTYYIRNLDMQASIIDIFATTLRHIWAAHWRHFYDGVPFDCSIITDRINKELQKLIRFQSDIY